MHFIVLHWKRYKLSHGEYSCRHCSPEGLSNILNSPIKPLRFFASHNPNGSPCALPSSILLLLHTFSLPLFVNCRSQPVFRPLTPAFPFHINVPSWWVPCLWCVDFFQTSVQFPLGVSFARASWTPALSRGFLSSRQRLLSICPALSRWTALTFCSVTGK